MEQKMYNKKSLSLGVIEYDFPEKLSIKINNFIENLPRRAWRNSGIGGNAVNTNIRSSNEILISEYDPILNQKIKEYLSACTTDYSSSFDTYINPDVQIILLRYLEGGEYKYHADNGPDFYRTVSFLIYINPTEYEGGETDFKFLNIKIKPEKAKLVFFPSSFIYTHAALPVIKGTKYVLVGWMNDIQ